MGKESQTAEIAIYEVESGTFEVRVKEKTVWLNQAQMGKFVLRDQSVI